MADSPWIEWNGGNCPVGGLCEVEIRLRDRKTAKDQASWFSWVHMDDDADNDIIAYRIVEDK